jgi:hypothetical protein
MEKKKSLFILVGALALMFGVGALLGSMNSSPTGFAVLEADVCSNDADCNDNVACTLDSCKNPGGRDSVCLYRTVEICLSGDGCCPAGCKAEKDSDC